MVDVQSTEHGRLIEALWSVQSPGCTCRQLSTDLSQNFADYAGEFLSSADGASQQHLSRDTQILYGESLANVIEILFVLATRAREQQQDDVSLS